MTTHTLRSAGVFLAMAMAAVVGWATIPILLGERSALQTPYWQITPFSALMGLLVVFLYLTTMIVSFSYLHVEEKKKILGLKDVLLYQGSIPLFVCAMLAAIFSNNTGVAWIALEATTITTTLLVMFYEKKSSVEAAWKYLLICSTGIGLSLFGVLLLSYAGASAGLVDGQAFSFTMLRGAQGSMSPTIVKWAFVFLFVGIGTKVGFVPMHTWLPDAHGKTPAPVSAMLSGVLLNVAFFSLLRFKWITDGVLGTDDWTGRFFLIFGAISVVVPALILLLQRNYKRMLAYSSVEHMGLMAFLIGLGPIGLIPFFMHMVTHSLCKSSLFYGAGELLQRFESTKFHRVHDVMRRAPRTGFLFLAALMLLLAAPPSSLFLSEYLLAVFGFSSHPWLTAAVFLGLTLACVGMLRHVLGMLFHPVTSEDRENIPKESWTLTHSVIAVELGLAVAFGFWCLYGPGTVFIAWLTTDTLTSF